MEAGEGVPSVENGKIALNYLEKGILWARSRAELSEVQMKCPALSEILSALARQSARRPVEVQRGVNERVLQ